VAVVSDSAKQVKRFIYDELDLGSVHQLARETYHWDKATADSAERNYRDFLWVCWNYARGETSMTWVSLLADKMGHCHLQTPAAYVAACERIFGKGRALVHMPLYDGRLVDEKDCAAARSHYTDLSLDLPGDLRNVCIWAVVST
jgi:hypothetical protein